MNKKIVVFGASGDTGRYFVQYFLAHNKDNSYEIIATGSRKTDYFDKLNVKYVQVDITQKDQFVKLPTDVYAVVDFAGLMPARMKGYDPQKYIDVNITGGLNILEYCKNAKADRILFMQSFGDIKDHAQKNKLLTVNLPPKFSYNSDHTIYVMSKNFMVDMIKNYQAMYGLKGFVFRLPTIYLYSPIDYYFVDGEPHKIGYRVLIDNAIAGKDIEVWGDPNRVKDMIYIKDFCQMLFNALFVAKDGGHYNVGTGIGTSLIEQIEGIVKVFCPPNKKSRLIMCPEKPNAPEYIMDIKEAELDLNYKPKYDYIAMLKDFKLEMMKH